MLTLESLTHPSNVLQLTNPGSFLNTTMMAGACFTPKSWCSDSPGPSDAVLVDVEPSYFSGYVFRGDARPPMLIFDRGFELQITSGSEMTHVKKTIGAKGGITDHYGISTSICAHVCTSYSTRASRNAPFPSYGNSGFVYLIDANGFKGFAIPSPRPWEPIVVQYPVLRDIFEVNFPSYIPGCYIVGIVWAMGTQVNGIDNCHGAWPHTLTRLWLAVNPNFEKNLYLTDKVMKGMDAAKYVVRQFNDQQVPALLGMAKSS
ncbi:hypothetical protein NX722_01660 [Endozoicomonas gorgoniicola]|uniref:Uncharacterized protein n=1 Tax=Endozoicomonas gorgoniicola TaxID=1234144 RepID=A0ABT3MQH6_9GAMM|nr:hypothetical protein [Endozoicomonas gorgoniicola]MCW7551368.1 hypothetical protein [Endozoicomonas gorgoniicola]